MYKKTAQRSILVAPTLACSGLHKNECIGAWNLPSLEDPSSPERPTTRRVAMITAISPLLLIGGEKYSENATSAMIKNLNLETSEARPPSPPPHFLLIRPGVKNRSHGAQGGTRRFPGNLSRDVRKKRHGKKQHLQHKINTCYL